MTRSESIVTSIYPLSCAYLCYANSHRVRYTTPYTMSMRVLNVINMCLAILFVGASMPVFAAQVSLGGAGEHGSSDTFYVPIRIDTQGECVNAVSVQVSYNPDILSVIDVSTGSSILSLWTKVPTIARDGTRELGQVSFEGGVPGGYCGRIPGDPGDTNTLAVLVVRATPQAVEASSTVRTSLVVDPTSVVYRNDGSGKPVGLSVLGVDVALVSATTTPADPWLTDVKSDAVAPELFDITLVHGPSVGNEKSYIVFSTTDKQSGVDHYEVLETDPDRFGFLTWVPRASHYVRAESPYVLRDQKLTSKILVKAIDKAGNERVVEYTPPQSLITLLTQPSVAFAVLGLIILVLLVLIAFTLARRRRRRLSE